jgi:hypothetical protein
MNSSFAGRGLEVIHVLAQVISGELSTITAVIR